MRRPADFAGVYENKLRAGDNVLLIFAKRNELDHSRIGLSVSRKHGNAVKRNRIKRLMREAYRLNRHDISNGWDLILIPRQNTAATLDDFATSLRSLVQKLDRKSANLPEDQSP